MSAYSFADRIQEAGGAIDLGFVSMQNDFLRWEGTSTEHNGSVVLASIPVDSTPAEQLAQLKESIDRTPEYRDRYNQWNLIRFHFTTVLTHERSATP